MTIQRNEGRWTEEVDELTLELAKAGLSSREIAGRLTERFGAVFTKDAVQKRKKHLLELDEDPHGRFIKYLERGRTLQQIANRFGITLEDAEEWVNQEYEGYEFWSDTDELGQTSFIMLPNQPEEITVADRAWRYQRQPDGQPWLWFEFPKNKQWKEIRIVPLSDVHYGAIAHADEKFDEYLQWIETNENVFCFINGDLLENALGDSIGGAIYDTKYMPRKQVHDMITKLAPIAHKILWALPGNHEARTRSKSGIDPLEYICDKLEVPYVNDSTYATIRWGDEKWEMFAQHGRSASQTKGGKMNAAAKPGHWQELVHFLIMGHVHDNIANSQQVVVRNHRDFKLELRDQYVVVCPSFYGYFNTYASRAAMAPGSIGGVALILYPNGKYRVNTW
jgi:UDP-2,3-diacylglucosamine pyrophosphatase LpxH